MILLSVVLSVCLPTVTLAKGPTKQRQSEP